MPDPPRPCIACSGAWPRAEDRIADCGLAIAYLYEDQYFPGRTVLVLKRHATELFDLGREERAQLMEELTAVARALARAFDAVKVNYELLGNQLPHIHWHVTPRLRDDPQPGGPIWTATHEPRPLAPPDLHARLTLIRSHLELERSDTGDRSHRP